MRTRLCRCSREGAPTQTFHLPRHPGAPLHMTDGGLITPAQWRALMDAVSLDGVRVPVALKRFGISPSGFRKFVRADEQRHAQYVRCVRYAKRRRWPELIVMEILEDLARTNMSLRDAVLRRGYSLRDYRNFNAMLFRKPEWKQAYLAARRAKVMRSRMQLMGVSDDELVARGKSWSSREAFRIHSMTSMRDRRSAAQQARQARAAQDPLFAARLRVAQAAKKTDRQQKET